MTAVVYQIRPFQNAIEQDKKLGTNATMAIIRRIKHEQRQGRSGNDVAYELQRQRLLGDFDTDPPGAA